MLRHDPGRGLTLIGRPGERWGGLGSCGLCGETAPEGTSPLLPQAVRWWDPDDGWRLGGLCLGGGQGAPTPCPPPRPLRGAPPPPPAPPRPPRPRRRRRPRRRPLRPPALIRQDRKSTRLNSSHSQISYAVFCLKKQK